MTDLERYLSLLNLLQRSLTTLKRYAQDVPQDRLQSDVDTQNMVLFALYQAVQAAIDLGQHLIAERALPIPNAYRDVFLTLEEAGILPRDLAQRLVGWAGLRNVIAHQYGKLELAPIQKALYEELEDLERYAERMAQQASQGA